MSELKPCPIAASVAAQVLERSRIGVEKYGVNLTRTDLTTLDWLNHLQQELLDGANYVERLKQDISRIERELIVTQAALKECGKTLTLCRNVLANDGGHSFSVSEVDNILSNPLVKNTMEGK